VSVVAKKHVQMPEEGRQAGSVPGSRQGALIFFPSGQSYEIRMLDNRKIGELPEINGKLVKVRGEHAYACAAGAVPCCRERRASSCPALLQRPP